MVQIEKKPLPATTNPVWKFSLQDVPVPFWKYNIEYHLIFLKPGNDQRTFKKFSNISFHSVNGNTYIVCMYVYCIFYISLNQRLGSVKLRKMPLIFLPNSGILLYEALFDRFPALSLKCYLSWGGSKSKRNGSTNWNVMDPNHCCFLNFT